jgi:arylsulfatase A-like enzyme
MIPRFSIWFIAGACLIGSANGTPPPNILFILMDDMGWRDAGCYGSSYYETPNMDRLAREGLRFTDAYVDAPVCTPSRACIISGQRGPRHGIYVVSPEPAMKAEWQRYQNAMAAKPMIPVENNKTLSASVVGLPTALKSAGYVTGFTGKWHHQPDPTAIGFDHHLLSKRNKDDPKSINELTRLTIEFMREHREQPFFFYLAHHAPHIPVEAREATIAKYRAKPTPADHHPEYAAMLEHADDGVGRLLTALDELKLSERTVVVLFSDNGGYLGKTSVAPLRGGKGQFYEGGIRVPLIVRWPGRIKAGSVCRTPVAGIDLYPTFLDVAGATRPRNHVLDGESLQPLLQGTGALQRDTLFWHHPLYTFGFDQSPCGVIRSGNYKLIEFFEDNHLELYDLAQDPGEQRNLAATMPDRSSQLHAQLKGWRASLHAPMPQTRTDKATTGQKPLPAKPRKPGGTPFKKKRQD